MTLIDKLRLCLRIFKKTPGNLFAHADRELPPPGDDGIQSLMNQQLKEMVLVFSTHGHSGFSAAYARGALAKLLAFEPLRPLTGEDSEWVEVGHGVWQNNRASHVFKQADRFNGQAYDINAVVFREPNGGTFTSGHSFRPITFPYTPAVEYRDILAEGQLKLFVVDEGTWYIGEDLESCLAHYKANYSDEPEAFDAPGPLLDNELDRLTYTDDDGSKRPFRDQLYIERLNGGEFPRLFAAENY